jgi:hypothetical protein
MNLPREDQTLAPTTVTPGTNLGFLTVLSETNGYLGGYLVTNQWGRPLEFRLSTAVQPNRVQQILYGGTLQPYICADLIGKTLVEKTAALVQLVLTDTEAVLDLRLRLDVPVAWVVAPCSARFGATPEPDPCLCAQRPGQGKVLCHPRFPADAAPVRDLLERLDGALEWGEPFTRIRDAINEARKMGVTGRSAG